MSKLSNSIRPTEGSLEGFAPTRASAQQRVPAITQPLTTIGGGAAFANALAPRTPTKLVVALLTIKARVAEWIEIAADHCAAAALYEQLSRLSDAELHRRGLARTKLARDVADTRRRRHGSIT